MTDPMCRSQTGFRLEALGDALGHVGLAGAWWLWAPSSPWHWWDSWVHGLAQQSCG